jgi:hypothetical protein
VGGGWAPMTAGTCLVSKVHRSLQAVLCLLLSMGNRAVHVGTQLVSRKISSGSLMPLLCGSAGCLSPAGQVTAVTHCDLEVSLRLRPCAEFQTADSHQSTRRSTVSASHVITSPHSANLWQQQAANAPACPSNSSLSCLRITW